MSDGRSLPHRRRHRRRWLKPVLWTIGTVILLLAVVSVIAILHAIRLEHRVQGLPAIVDAAEVAAENGHLAIAKADLASAQQTLTSVNSSLFNSPDFSVVHVLPVGRQNLDAIRRTINLGLEVVGGGEQLLSAASPLENAQGHLDVSLNGGKIPLATTEAVSNAISDLVANLPASPDVPSGSFVVGRIRSLERRLYADAFRRRQQLDSVGIGVRLLQDMAGANGAHRYLIAVGNSAEMRGSGGMILSYGVLSSVNGQLTLDHFGPIDELMLTQAETKVAFPSDFDKSEGYLAPTQLWRNANLMSDFTIDAPVLEAMYTQATGGAAPIDGVIQVDPAGMGAILAGIGPVQTADLGVLTSSNVVPVTLSQAYFLYGNRSQRQDYTGEAAQATFAKLTSGRFSTLRPLATALLQAGLARHILMYANDSTDEAMLTSLGFDGSLPPPTAPLVQLTVQNYGGNKLDYYLHTSVALAGKRLAPADSQITATVSVTNDAPAGQTSPAEVFGPSYAGEQAGEYVGLVTLYLPAHSYLAKSQLDPTVTSGPSQGSQNGVATISYQVAIPAGGSSQVVLHLLFPSLPPRTTKLLVVPTPRVISTVYTQKYT